MATDLGLVAIVEDALSAAVIERLVRHINPARQFSLPIDPLRGITKIRAGMTKYLNASYVIPHVVLVDLDQQTCAPSLLAQWGLNALPPRLLFRVAVRETESWLLADRAGFAKFASIPVVKVPTNPELEPDPKRSLINLVRGSRRKRLVAELVPPTGSRVSMGPLYNEVLGEFVRTQWQVNNAMENAPSLAKAVLRLQAFLR